MTTDAQRSRPCADCGGPSVVGMGERGEQTRWLCTAHYAQAVRGWPVPRPRETP